MLLITHGINRNKKEITVWHRHNHVSLEQLLSSSFNLSGLEAHHTRLEAEEPPFIRQEEMMMTELLTTSNTTACTTTAPCLDTDPSLEDKEHMVDHWQGLLENSVMPMLKKHSLIAWCQEGKAAAQRAKRHGINVYLHKFKWIIPKLRGGRGMTFSHIVMVVCISSSNTEF